MKRFKAQANNRGALKVIFCGALFSVVLLLALSLAFAFIAGFTKDPASMSGIFSTLSLLITGAICGFSVSKYKGEGGTLAAALSSLLFVLVLILAALIINGGRLAPATLINYLCHIAVAVLFSFAGRQRKKSYRR